MRPVDRYPLIINRAHVILQQLFLCGLSLFQTVHPFLFSKQHKGNG